MYLIIDSSALGHAAQYATGGLEHKNKMTGVIYGFCRQILTLSDTFQTAKFIFCWDGKDYIRKRLYPEYKRTRTQEMTPEEIKDLELTFMQFEQLYRDVLPALGFRNNFRMVGYEADDIIAYIVKEYEESWVVVSSDADLYQLLDYCKLYSQRKHSFFTKEDLAKEYGVVPSQWADVKAIAGCNSDNIVGISGVGEKSAASYLVGSLKPISKKYKDIVSELGKKESIVERNRKLVTLPIEGFPGVNLVSDVKIEWSDFETMCREFGFRSFLKPAIANEWSSLFEKRC